MPSSDAPQAKYVTAPRSMSEMLNAIIEAVYRGAGLADNTSAALNDIVSGVENIESVMSGIATANEEQATAVEQICTGM